MGAIEILQICLMLVQKWQSRSKGLGSSTVGPMPETSHFGQVNPLLPQTLRFHILDVLNVGGRYVVAVLD